METIVLSEILLKYIRHVMKLSMLHGCSLFKLEYLKQVSYVGQGLPNYVKRNAGISMAV